MSATTRAPIAEQIAAVERWLADTSDGAGLDVAAGRMTADAAQRELAPIRAALATLRLVGRHDDVILTVLRAAIERERETRAADRDGGAPAATASNPATDPALAAVLDTFPNAEVTAA